MTCGNVVYFPDNIWSLELFNYVNIEVLKISFNFQIISFYVYIFGSKINTCISEKWPQISQILEVMPRITELEKMAPTS